MRRNEESGGSSRDYKRGAIMGLTVAEAFILLSFVLLLLFTWWQVDADERSIRLADNIGTLTAEEKHRIVIALGDGTFEMADFLREAGLGIGDRAALTDTASYSRFMRDEDLKRLMAGAVKLPPGTLLDLSEAVEITPGTRLRAALNDVLRPDSAVETAGGRIREAAEREREVIGILGSVLGERIYAAGGAIAPDGTITLPQQVLFDAGSATIRDAAFLREFCTSWVETLRDSGLDISELKIEGHASSEGQPRQNPAQAYLYNLDLSQRRASNALQTCLQGIEDPEILDWARSHLAAVGYSSAHLVRDAQGAEDREASRRVMFAMTVDRERLLDEVRQDLDRTWAPPKP